MTHSTRRLPFAAIWLTAFFALGPSGVQAESGGTRTRAASALPAEVADDDRTALLQRALATVQGAVQRTSTDAASGPVAAPEGAERGSASWYGRLFHMRRTASGEKFDMRALTAAHPSLPFGTRVCVQSLINGRNVQVRINDRGPHVGGRIIDLSQAAADAIGMLGRGTKLVVLRVLGRDDQCIGSAAAVLETGG